MRHLFLTIVLILFIEFIHSQVVFESLCSSEVGVSGMSSVDGNEDFEIEFYETKFLPDDTIYCKKLLFVFFLLSIENKFWEFLIVSIKQKQQNYGIHEFVLSAFDYDGNPVGRFVDQPTESLALRHHSCPTGSSVCIQIQYETNKRFLKYF